METNGRNSTLSGANEINRLQKVLYGVTLKLRIQLGAVWTSVVSLFRYAKATIRAFVFALSKVNRSQYSKGLLGGITCAGDALS